VPEQRIVEASVVLPRFGGVTGWAALRWAGGVWFDGTTGGGRDLRVVTLATGYADVLNQPGIQISQERLGPTELMVTDGLSVTSHVRSVCFEMRYASSTRAAVEVLDMAAYSDLVSIDEVTCYALHHSGWTGIPQCRDALALADESSWSPRETRMRLIWILDAGLPPPLCNTPVFDERGRHVGTPDILDPAAGVVGEYDGSLHLEGTQRRRDRAREEAFRSLGLEYFTVMKGDPTPLVVSRMLTTRARAKFLAEDTRLWTIESPAWWIPTRTVAQRRALESWQRERWLGTRLSVG
jgi:hypothetical protein